MTCQFDELYLGLNQGFLNLIQHRFVTFSSASLEVSLSADGTPSILKVFDCTALFLHKKLQWLYSVFLISSFAREGNFYLDRVGES